MPDSRLFVGPTVAQLCAERRVQDKALTAPTLRVSLASFDIKPGDEPTGARAVSTFVDGGPIHTRWRRTLVVPFEGDGALFATALFEGQLNSWPRGSIREGAVAISVVYDEQPAALDPADDAVALEHLERLEWGLEQRVTDLLLAAP